MRISGTDISKAVLPTIFHIFSARPNLNIFASKSPAKKFVSDFYDCDLLMPTIFYNESSCLRESVPDALFMMIMKMLIRTYVEIYKHPAAIAQETNRQLCSGNEAEMFVTAQIGILERSIGIFTAVDIRFEFPFVNAKTDSSAL